MFLYQVAPEVLTRLENLIRALRETEVPTRALRLSHVPQLASPTKSPTMTKWYILGSPLLIVIMRIIFSPVGDEGVGQAPFRPLCILEPITINWSEPFKANVDHTKLYPERKCSLFCLLFGWRSREEYDKVERTVLYPESSKFKLEICVYLRDYRNIYMYI